MKAILGHIRILSLMLVTLVAMGFTATSNSAPAPDRDISPECVSACSAKLFECFLDGGKNNDHDNACFSIYRHCIAQCDKH